MRFHHSVIRIATLLLTLGLVCSSCHREQRVWLFTSFHEPANQGLRMLYSYDGIHWTDLDTTLLKPEVGNQQVLRDPSIARGADGTFHMVWTSSWQGDPGFGYASSMDLINWSEQRFIPVMAHEPSTVNVWAPELYYEDETGEFFILWASTIPYRFDKGMEEERNNHRIYYTVTRDFRTFSETRLFLDPGFSVIDATIVKRGTGDYVLVLKDNTRPERNLKVAFSGSPHGPWSEISPGFTAKFTEGPTIVPVEGQWLIYYDAYREKKYGAVKTTDFLTFSDATPEISVPGGHKHGTIFAADEKVLEGLLALSGGSLKPGNQLAVHSLKCEMLKNPRGIDNPEPLLSWNLSATERNTMQSAYRIKVASSQAMLEQDSADLWDSGKTGGDGSTGIRYEGKPLRSGMKVFWKVKVWSGDHSSAWSEPGSWSMGLLHQNDWKGRWIGFDRAFPWDREEMHSRLSARYFRKEFRIDPEREVQDATLYIMGLGLYELYLNGHKVGNQVLAPSPTDYQKNVKYNTFEVADLLASGENAMGVILGNGRYYTMQQHYKPYKIKNFGYPKLLLNLVIRYANGDTEVISTDDSWKGTADGPIRSNNEYDGETYDARKELGEWTLPRFNDAAWMQAEFVQEPGGAYEAQVNENMTVMDTVRPVSITQTGEGTYMIDMGQNMAGWLRMQVRGTRGTTVRMRFAESLKEDGALLTENLREAQSTDYYILKGERQETWQPAFVYHGFRFVEVSGYPGTPGPEDFLGLVVYDQLPATGQFSSSDTLLNQLFSNAFWSISGNYKGMPVDCPQRDERQPWLGDRAMSSYGESYLFDNARLYAKWLEDIRLAQRKDGSIPDVAPAYWRYYSDNMSWAGTYLLVADMLYRQYGDLRSLNTHYPSMKKWLGYMKERYLVDGIMTKDSYGDWCAPPATIEEGYGRSGNVKYPSALISTAYYYHFLQLMQKFASLTGHPEDIPGYLAEADLVKDAFNRDYLSGDRSYYGNNTLTENLLAVSLGLVPDDLQEEILATIEGIIRDNDNHLSSGIIGMQWLMRTLARHGREDLALRIATNTTYPSWGYMIAEGATTIWELWNGNTAAPDMNSQNHVMMLGDVLIWYFEDLAGIRSHPAHPGFKRIVMDPGFPEGLEYVEASYRSVHGTIESSWSRTGRTLTWTIGIPANTSAEVHLPSDDPGRITESGDPLKRAEGIVRHRKEGDQTVVEIGSGMYHFTIKE